MHELWWYNYRPRSDISIISRSALTGQKKTFRPRSTANSQIRPNKTNTHTRVHRERIVGRIWFPAILLGVNYNFHQYFEVYNLQLSKLSGALYLVDNSILYEVDAKPNYIIDTMYYVFDKHQFAGIPLNPELSCGSNFMLRIYHQPKR